MERLNLAKPDMNKLLLFHDTIDEHFVLNPDSPAIISSTDELSFKELIVKSSAVSNHLIQKGITQNNIVGIFADNSIEFILSIMALWNIGAVPLPINIRLTEIELEGQLNFAGVKFLLTNRDVNLPGQIKIDIREYAGLTRQGFFSVDMHSSSTALIMFTSGTTGKPKTVVHSFETLTSSLKISLGFLDYQNNERWLASLPFYHIGGFQIFIRAFLTGSSVILPDEIKNESLLNAMYEFRPTYASFVPTQLRFFVENGIKPVESLKQVLIGGGFISQEIISRAKANGWNAVKVYGSTETASLITALKKDDDKINSAGKPLPSVEIKILNDKGRELAINQSGEIAVNSPTLFINYLNNEEEYKSKFIDDFYLTGDFGHLDEEGYLFVEARRTDLIISGGENINPFEIEEVLLSYSGIKEAVVFQLEDSKWGQIPAAAITLSEKISAAVLQTFLRERLADYKIPRRIFYLDELPKTPLGKIQKEKVKEICDEL